MISRRLLFVTVAAAALGIGFVACGGDDYGSTAATEAPAATTAQAAGPTTPASAAGEVLKVTASDFKFDPPDLVASVGNEVAVQLTNTGNAPHTLTVYSDDAYTQKLAGAEARASAGQKAEFTVTFEKAGNYYFRCEIHPAQMRGEIKAA